MKKFGDGLGPDGKKINKMTFSKLLCVDHNTAASHFSSGPMLDCLHPNRNKKKDLPLKKKHGMLSSSKSKHFFVNGDSANSHKTSQPFNDCMTWGAERKKKTVLVPESSSSFSKFMRGKKEKRLKKQEAKALAEFEKEYCSANPGPRHLEDSAKKLFGITDTRNRFSSEKGDKYTDFFKSRQFDPSRIDRHNYMKTHNREFKEALAKESQHRRNTRRGAR